MKTLNACFGRPFEPAVLSRLRRIFLAGSAGAVLLLLAPLAHAEDRTVLSGHVPRAVANAVPVGPLSGDTHLHLAIGLPLRDPQGLTNFLSDIYNPKSSNYHHYLTPAEFTEKFGPTVDDYRNVIAFARANGFVITNMAHPNRMVLDVDAPVSAIEKAFKVQMRLFKHPKENRNFYAPTNEPSVPAGLRILDISGLSDYILPHPNYRVMTNSSKTTPKLGSGPFGTYMGADLRNAYVPGVSLKGSGQVVGLLQFDGYYASDITSYENLNNLPAVPLQNVLLDGYNGAPTGNGGEVEVSLDLEMVISMAPNIDAIYVYEAGPFGTPNDILNRMANDNIAKQLSCSWGWGGGPQATTEQIFLQMAAQGQTFCNAAGDGDAFAPGQVDDPNYPGSPASSPNILEVGGTTLSTSGPAGTWVSEVVWQWGFGSGTSGGVSSFYSIPTWQEGINMTTNMGSTTHRNIPDVAMVGDNILVIADQGIQMPVGGTSCAAPLWGAFTSLINEQAASGGLPPVGFMNPAIYGIGTGLSYTNCFHDITVGNNTNDASPDLYYACPGYDLCDGWGTPTGSNLINTLAPVSPVPVFTITTNFVVGGNGNGVVDPNECNSLFIALQNIGTAAATSVQVQMSTTTPGVTVAQGFATYANMTNGQIATNLNPFEISTTPTFICGTPIYLTLTVKCDQTIGTVVLKLPSGQPGQPVRFDNSTPVVVATGTTNGTASSVLVTNIDGALEHVAVSAFLFESFDFDLTLQLVAPDGTAITLVQNVLDAGQDFGIDCNDSDRTTFDDNAPVSIVNSQSPFNGTFQPMEPLSRLVGKEGTNVNGAWQLLAVDPYSGDYCAIECWSLFLTPAVCTDGGGQCPGVDLKLGMTGLPNPVQVYSNLTYTMTVTNLGPDTATSVALIQNLPNSVTVVSNNASQGSITVAGNLLTCNLGTLVVGQSATVTVVVNPQQPGTIYSSATVGAQEQQLVPGDNSATVAVQVQAPAADLAVTLTGNPSPVLLDGLLTYTATIANHGPAAASNVIFTNILPQSVLLISESTTKGSIASSANIVIGSLGTLGAGSNATITMRVQPLALGPITDTASVSSTVNDPSPGNNVATLTINVTPAADLALTMTAPADVVIGDSYNYVLTVVNNGPSAATDVTLHDAVPGLLNVDSADSSDGVASISGNLVTCVVTNLPPGGSFTTTIGVDTESVFDVPSFAVNTASVSSDQADPFTNNNTATLTTRIDYPTVTVVASSYQLISESALPTNGMIDPGETVSVAFALQNIGNIDTGSSLTATLLNSGGVTPVGNPTRTYPMLAAGGPAASQTFTFTASPTNGGIIIASLQVQNNGTNLPIITNIFTLSLSNNFANTNNIIIPDHGPGQPSYPSTINVAGLGNIIGKINVNFTNFNHTYPDDVDMLLVHNGHTVLLMSHAGYNGVLTNTQITFDSGVTNSDATPKLLPSSSQIVSGSYQPGGYDPTNVNFTNTFGGTITVPTNNPPPNAPYGTNLNVFNGMSANGQWSLYVFDSAVGDQGIIIGGWSLGITTGFEVNPVADISISGKSSPNPVLEGTNLTFTFVVTNAGPNLADIVQFTDALPAGLTFVSATNSAHVPCVTNGNGVVTCALTNMAPNSIVTFTVVTIPNASGSIGNTATVAGSEADPNQSNNSATVMTTVNAPVADVAVAMSGATNAVIGSNVLYSINVVNNGPGAALNVVLTDAQGSLQFVSGLALGSAGQPSSVSNHIVCNIGTLAPGADAIINLVLTSSNALTITNTVTVTTGSSDTNSTNNSASVVTVFNNPSPSIVATSAHLVAGPANGSIVPGQNATVSLGLANVGTANTTSNFTATLLASNGVTSPSGPVRYGVLVAGGSAVSGNFTYTATGANNGSNVLTLQLADGTNNLGTVSFTFNLPGTNAFAANVYILIPDHGAATPYPSTVVVSNLQGVIAKATVTISNFTHQFPNDVEMLLEAPSGQNVVLMAHNGGGSPVTNLDFTFDDSASTKLPQSSDTIIAPLVSGTFQPTDDGLALPFPSPAPQTPSGAAMSAFNGVSPNGTWSLFVFDNSAGDSGGIASGWSLSLDTISPVNQPSDLALSMTSPAGSLYPTIPAVINFSVTNNGPADATDVTVTNALSSGLSFVSSSVSYSVNGSSIFCHLGTIPAGTSTNFTLAVSAASGGNYHVNATIGADQTDANLFNNSAQATFFVQGGPRVSAQPVAINGALGLTLTITGGSGNYKIVSSTNLFTPLTNWTTVTNITSTNGIFQFTDTNLIGFKQRYYRAVFVP